MATKKKESTALATSDDSNEAAALAELEEFFDEVGFDGLEDVGGEDVKLAVKLWNMRGLGKDGRSIPRDVFFDTIDETTSDTIECVFLLTQKTKRYDSFDNALDKTIVHCESGDRITGTMSDGTRRPCNGCPDDGWFKSDEGKTFRKCGEVHNVVAIERASQKPFVIRFKKTSLKPWRKYVMAHHWGARKGRDGKRANVPLFVYSCGLTLKMHESGNYALPVLTRGDMLARDEVLACGESAKAYVEIMGEVQKHADEHESAHASSDRQDGSLSSEDFAD